MFAYTSMWVNAVLYNGKLVNYFILKNKATKLFPTSSSCIIPIYPHRPTHPHAYLEKATFFMPLLNFLPNVDLNGHR